MAVTDIDGETLQYDARDDWFGDGTAFNSQADLADALRLMTDASDAHPAATAPLGARAAYVADTDIPAAHAAAPERGTDTEPGAEFEEPAAPPGDGGAEAGGNGAVQEWDASFEFVHAHTAESMPVHDRLQPAAVAHADPKVATWSVRVPGVQLLPQRQPGRTGWSMENSVRILRQADELVVRLREEAIVTAFSATARALRGGDAASE